MDVKKTDLIVKRSLAKAASLKAEHVFDDTQCTNPFQNIFVVATPFEANARACARVQEVSMGKTVIGLVAYVAASDDTCKRVIRGINVDLSDAELTEMIVNRRNPDALGGEDHKKCRGCGVQSPSPDHQCDPTCAICGGAHRTADRKCRKHFQVPYIVRQRRRRRRRRARHGSDTAGGEEAMTEEESFSSTHRSRSASRGCSRSRGRDKGSSRSLSRGRSGSKDRVQKQMSWNNARMNIPSGKEVEMERWVVGYGEDMHDVPDGHFDAVVVTHLLCSVHCPEKVLQECRRVLVKVNVHNYASLKCWQFTFRTLKGAAVVG
ncbi:hypothetical protein HPB52_012580 [Rhipicephalus sanguineus]|uniref:Methyltransferase type 11 domain-containing protein n=1 Tax=Rhipicephalus sanguineus TaxID=34632 RepID=A0A9D4PPQ0_RHISA|nr:hypothetical protein HPB52_012580 [Rhipicephalus sanguineus]